MSKDSKRNKEEKKRPSRFYSEETVPAENLSAEEDSSGTDNVLDTTEKTEVFTGDVPIAVSGKSGILHLPPAVISGYTLENFIGHGAYGEVWLARQDDTQRRVAIKFYTHKNALNPELLSQEVEKLALLFTDRNIVQLLSVGWESTPPYYVMEFLDNGSLADRLHHGKLERPEAERIFEEILYGMRRAHEKGIVHCDLKPGNILLDHDGNPRLADFGQSRLSNEMTPALGTLFYMPPEQASFHAKPDVRWDVYSLGAILYNLLMGNPPHYRPDLVEQIQAETRLTARLRVYRHALRNSPVPTDHRVLLGADTALSQIIEKCLQPQPKDRFQSVAELCEAWEHYKTRKLKRPLIIFGTILPIVLLAIMGIFVTWAFHDAFRAGIQALTQSALESERFAAQSVAKNAEYELVRRKNAVEDVAWDPDFRKLAAEVTASPEWIALTEKLKDPAISDRELAQVQTQFINLPGRIKIQNAMEALIPDEFCPEDFHGAELREAMKTPTARVLQHENKKILEVLESDEDETSDALETPAEEAPPGFLPGELTPSVPIHDVSKRLNSNVASWFFCDNFGFSGARIPFSTTIGKNYIPLINRNIPADSSEICEFDDHLEQTQISKVFQSPATGQWMVAITTPVFSPTDETEVIGIVSMAVGVGQFVDMLDLESQFAVLVDARPGEFQGVILQHPLYDKLIAEGKPLPDAFLQPEFRVTPEILPDSPEKGTYYHDPMSHFEGGKTLYDGHWLAQYAEVAIDSEDAGHWIVIVQRPYDKSIGLIFQSIGKHIFRINIVAVLSFCAILILTMFVIRYKVYRK